MEQYVFNGLAFVYEFIMELCMTEQKFNISRIQLLLVATKTYDIHFYYDIKYYLDAGVSPALLSGFPLIVG